VVLACTMSVIITVLLSLFKHHLVHALADDHLLLQLFREECLFLHLIVDLQWVQNTVALKGLLWTCGKLLSRITGYWIEMADDIVVWNIIRDPSRLHYFILVLRAVHMLPWQD